MNGEPEVYVYYRDRLKPGFALDTRTVGFWRWKRRERLILFQFAFGH
jgi:hypothetical protein